MISLRQWIAAALLAVLCGCSASGGANTALPMAGADERTTAAAVVKPETLINAGGAAAGSWVADTGFGGGWVPSATKHPIDTSKVLNPAPQAVYATNRVGNFRYVATGLTPAATYTLRLHFAETFWNAIGKRIFDVAVNGRAALTNFDVFKDSEGQYVADVKSFAEATDATGTLTIVFTSVADQALVSGIEIVAPSPAKPAPAPAPLPSPSPAATVPPATISANVATYDGCTIGTAGDAYNRDISNDPVDPNSAVTIASQVNVDPSSFATETYYGIEKVNLDEADTATKYPVVGEPAWHPDLAGDWPWQSGYFIEYNGAGDAHGMVLDTVSKPGGCKIYESYSTGFTGAAVTWNTGIMWDLSQPYQTPLQLGYPNGGSVQAAGLSLFRGLTLLDQVAAGNLEHAVNFDAKAGSLGNCFVSPGSATGSTPYTGTGTAHEMCLGAHLRLHPSFASAACANSPQAAHIVYGLMHYGGYESDTGSDGNGLYLGASNTTNVWDESGLSACLATIHMTDFDVLVPRST